MLQNIVCCKVVKCEDDMGMSNEEIAALMAEGEIESVAEPAVETPKSSIEPAEFLLTQDEMDSLLSGFVSDDESGSENLIDEIYDAILDSGKLSLMQWVKLRERLRQIEELIPHIDLIIRLKSKNEKKRTDFN